MGISGFEPSFFVGLDAIKTAHGARLAALAGRPLTGFSVVRFAEDGDWFADCPVILEFDDVHLEICHWNLDELSISWNTIDTAKAIAGWEWAEFTPEWSQCDEWLEPFLGHELREVALLAWRPTKRELATQTVAVEFVFDTGGLRIANGLDENSIEVGAAHRQYRRHQLGR